jgi:exodeoxyribonuclease-3
LPRNENDIQARYLEAKILIEKPISVSTIYLPNGNPVDTDKFPYKLDWMDRLYAHIKKKLIIAKLFYLVAIIILYQRMRMLLIYLNGIKMHYITLNH